MTNNELANKKKFAYVMLVMRGDSYAPGAIAMAESIRMSGSKYDILCMCTPDVSEHARQAIATVATVYEINYVQFDTKPMRTARQRELYGSWLCQSYTKWRCLELTNYDKILFVDADMIVVQNIDHLFELTTPAGTFSTPWAREYTPESTFDLHGYPTDHAAVVTAETIMKTFERGNGYTMIASMVLLEPNLAAFQALCQMVASQQPFGLDNWSTPDEQSIVYYYASSGVAWHHIHQRYNFIISKPQWITYAHADGDKRMYTPHVLHYFAEKKPWNCKNSFNKSPFPTDLVWWYVLRHWWLRTQYELKLERFDEMKDSSKITIRNSRLIQNMFPWIPALNVPFPPLF